MTKANSGKNLWSVWGLEARRLYVSQGFAVSAIAKLMPVSEKTLYKWRNEDEWEIKKEENDSSNQALATQLKKSIKAFSILLEDPNRDWKEKAQLSNAIHRNFIVVNKIEGAISKKLAASMTFDEMIKYFKANYEPEAIELISKTIIPFMQYLAESE